MNRFHQLSAAIGILLLCGSAEATLVTRGVAGEVTSVNGGASNIAVGDAISGSVAFDDQGITPGAFSFVPLDGSDSALASGSLRLAFPDDPSDLVLNETDADFFGFGFPSINFDPSGDFTGFDFTVSGLNGFGLTNLDLRTGTFSPTFSFFQGGTEVVSGELALQKASQGVPAPGSFALLGVGLLSLGFVLRQRNLA